MTTLQLGHGTAMGAPLWYAHRDSLGKACSVLLLVLLFSMLATPIAEQVERLKEKTMEIALSEPEPTPQPEAAPAPVTPPAPTPLVKDIARPVTPAQMTPASTAPVQSPPSPVTPTPSAEAVQRAAPAPTAVSNSEQTRTAPATPPVVAATQPVATAPSSAVQTDRYEAQILRYLESIKRYPSSREARQIRPSGIVTVWFELSRAGKVLDAGIEKGSNSSLLDYEALKTVRGGNFPSFPDGVFNNAEKHRFAAHLSYELKTSE